MILDHKSADTSTDSQSLPDLQTHQKWVHNSTSVLFVSLSQNNLWLWDEINVCLSKDKTGFARESRGEEKSQEQWLSLEEPAMLLSMMLKSCIFQHSSSPLHTPQSFYWMHCVYQAIPQESKQGYMAATLLSHNRSNNKLK